MLAPTAPGHPLADPPLRPPTADPALRDDPAPTEVPPPIADHPLAAPPAHPLAADPPAAGHPPTPADALTDHDADLLHTLICSADDPATLPQRLRAANTHLADLLDWAAAPAVQRHLAAYRALLRTLARLSAYTPPFPRETPPMPRVCYFTGKKTSFGKKRAWRGQAIQKGGFGLKPTGITPRTFKPNLQQITALIDGRPVRVKASAKAIRTGLVVKPLKRKYAYTRQQKADAA